MRNNGYKFALTFLWLLWTAGVLYGSLAPGDDLPTGWFAWIPHFDKMVHFGFYTGEAVLLMWLFQPQGWRRAWIVVPLILGSALIECLQGLYFNRSNDLWDLLANTLGTFFGLYVAPRLQNWIIRYRENRLPQSGNSNVLLDRKNDRSV